MVGPVDLTLASGDVDVPVPAPDHPVIRVGGQEGHLPCEPLGMAQIVCIHARHDRCPSFDQQLVQAGYQPAVLTRDGPNTTVLGRIARENGASAICRSIIEDQELEIGEGLTEHAVDRGREVALAVEDAQRDAQGRGGAHAAIEVKGRCTGAASHGKVKRALGCGPPLPRRPLLNEFRLGLRHKVQERPAVVSGKDMRTGMDRECWLSGWRPVRTCRGEPAVRARD